MACPESCLGWCDEHLSSPLQVALHTPQQFCKSIWGGHNCPPLTGKNTEAWRSKALRFPGSFVFLVPTHSTMGAPPTAWVGTVHPRDDSGFINRRISECSVVRTYEPETLEL